MEYKTFEHDSVEMDENSPFFLDHVSRYWWAQSLLKGKKVLDCACGKGYGSYILSQGAKAVVGIDLNPQSLQLASQNFKKPNLQFKKQDILALSTMGEKFDAIVAFEVIEHIPPEQTHLFIQQLRAALNPGGVLLLSTPNHDVVLKSGVFVPEFHINNFKPWDLRSALKKQFSSVQMLGQFRSRGTLKNLALRLDIFSLRHALRRLLQGNTQNLSPANQQPKTSEKRTQNLYENPPQEYDEYIFSSSYWRQAGLTVCFCKV